MKLNMLEMRSLVLSACLLCAMTGHTQDLLQLYNPKGQLRALTSLTITREQVALLNTLQDSLIEDIVLHLPYPPVAASNGMETKLIYRIDIDSSGNMAKLYPLEDKGWGFDAASGKYLATSRFMRLLAPSGGQAYTWFIPVTFQLFPDENEALRVREAGYRKQFVNETGYIPVWR
jgi:hypothetical protein